MIELLIVIAVLGILAVAVLSAINPIEQVNRAKDTGLRSDSEQLLSGIERFYNFSQYYPWETSKTQGGTGEVTWQVITGLSNDAGQNFLDVLSQTQAQEIKQAFVNRLKQRNDMFISKALGAESNVYICFRPQSGAFKKEAEERCNSTDTSLPTSACNNTDDCGTLGACICLP